MLRYALSMVEDVRSIPGIKERPWCTGKGALVVVGDGAILGLIKEVCSKAGIEELSMTGRGECPCHG